jgi:general secretion pathway protein G
MIELIFVIVIIGILAAVAIPKMAATRTNATATTCAHELGQLLSEVSAKYTNDGGAKYATRLIPEVTNLNTGAIAGDGDNGLVETAAVVATTLTYMCAGETVGSIVVNPATNTLTTTAVTPTVGGIAEAVINKLDGTVFTKGAPTTAKVVSL